IQLLVRRSDRAGGDRRRPYSARAAGDATEIDRRHVGGCEPGARRTHVDFPGRHRWSAVLDRADSAPRSAAWQRTATPARGFTCALVHFRRARGRTFLEGVPIGL